LPVRGKCEIGKGKWLDHHVLQQGTVDLGDLEVEHSVSIEAKYVATQALFLCLGVEVVSKIANAFKVRQVESVVDSQTASSVSFKL